MSDYPCSGTQREQELMLYVGGELLPRERRRIEGHLRNCALCRKQKAALLLTMQSVAAEVRGGVLPRWHPQGMVSAMGVSGRFYSKPASGARLATMATISAAIAVLTSYMAANYGDHLRVSHSVPLSRASIAVVPFGEKSSTTRTGSCLKPAKPCRSRGTR